MCTIHMMCIIGTVCLRVADPHYIFDRIGVYTIQTHMCCHLPEDLSLALKQLLSFCPIPILPTLLRGGHMWSNSTSRRTIDPAKQWVVVIKGFVIRVNNIPPPHLCTPHHEPIADGIYHLFREIIV